MNAALKIFTAGVLCCALSSALASSAVRISEDHGFIDIDLPIAAVSDNDGLVRITARGTIDGTEVGFEVDFPSRGGPGTRAFLPTGVARIRSIGAPSDHFVMFLSQRYRLPAPGPTMVSSVDASVVGLEGDPQRVLDGTTKMKFFFFDSGPEDRYAEVFVNVDAKNRVLEFHEKDPDYRKPLLLDLTKGS
jgi:hypothetical protein